MDAISTIRCELARRVSCEYARAVEEAARMLAVEDAGKRFAEHERVRVLLDVITAPRAPTTAISTADIERCARAISVSDGESV